jgi:hypothetical protein
MIRLWIIPYIRNVNETECNIGLQQASAQEEYDVKAQNGTKL